MLDQDAHDRIPALATGGFAIVTGGASGIGLAAAKRFAALNLRVVIVDRDEDALRTAARIVPSALVKSVDVASVDEMAKLRDEVAAHGHVAVLMNNAGVMFNPGSAFANVDRWRALMEVNFWGVLNGVHAFAPLMARQAAPSLIVNTGSKQGVTTPPGNAAYNVSKAAVKVFTEALAHELRNTPDCKAAAHLLIPGYTWTGMTARGESEKPAGAWSGDQVVDFMLESIARGDFYILCPDNEVARATDEKRMAWAAGDIIDNRPALSRWHPDYAEAFKRYMES